jgi:hypothetical protein
LEGYFLNTEYNVYTVMNFFFWDYATEERASNAQW